MVCAAATCTRKCIHFDLPLKCRVNPRRRQRRSCISWAATATAMTSGSLPTTPGTPMGLVTASSSAWAEAARFEPVPEGGPLALAADQPDEGQVGALAPALQAGGQDVQVLGMAEAHDQHLRAGFERGHRAVHRLGMLAAHVERQLGGEDLFAAVDPVRAHRQRAQHRDDGQADMAAAEQRHRHVALQRMQQLVAHTLERRRAAAVRSAARPRRRSTGPATGRARSGVRPPPAGRASSARASAMASNSSLPPPMVPIRPSA